MKKLLLILFVMFSVGVNAQELYEDDIVPANNKIEGESKEAKSKRKKALEARQDSIDFNNAKVAMKKMNFVIPAERISFKDGTTLFPQSSTNFISVTDGKGMVQLAFSNGYLGYNGLGGITVEGNVSNMKYKTDKKGNVNLTFSVQGVSISAQISITVYADSNQAMAMVMPNFSSQSLTVSGKLIPVEFTNLFKGNTR